MAEAIEVYLRKRPIQKSFYWGLDIELPIHKDYYYRANKKECCEWGVFVLDLASSAHKAGFPELLIDWKKAEKLWRTKSATGDESFRQVSTDEVGQKSSASWAYNERLAELCSSCTKLNQPPTSTI